MALRLMSCVAVLVGSSPSLHDTDRRGRLSLLRHIVVSTVCWGRRSGGNGGEKTA